MHIVSSVHSDSGQILLFSRPRKLKLRMSNLFTTCLHKVELYPNRSVGLLTAQPVLFMLFSTGDMSSLAKSTSPCLWVDFRTIWWVFQSHMCQFHLQESLPDVSWNMFHRCWWSFAVGIQTIATPTANCPSPSPTSQLLPGCMIVKGWTPSLGWGTALAACCLISKSPRLIFSSLGIMFSFSKQDWERSQKTSW